MPEDYGEELSVRALAWARSNGLPHECTIGNLPAVIFREAEDAVHGNFHRASYQCICRRPEWRRRLQKSHTSARRNLVSHDRERSELDTAASSDALLMNIFCHPQAFASGSLLRVLLGTEPPERLQFGSKPRIPLIARSRRAHRNRSAHRRFADRSEADRNRVPAGAAHAASSGIVISHLPSMPTRCRRPTRRIFTIN